MMEDDMIAACVSWDSQEKMRTGERRGSPFRSSFFIRSPKEENRRSEKEIGKGIESTGRRREKQG